MYSRSFETKPVVSTDLVNFEKSPYGKTFSKLILAAFLPFFLFSTPSLSATIDIPSIPSLYVTNSSKSLGNGGVLFDIDKRTTILIKLPGVAKIGFDYVSDGYFRLSHTATAQSAYKIDPYFLMGRSVFKGKGRLELDMRNTLQWSSDNMPLLILEGTGKFTIKNLKVEAVSNPTAYRSEKNSAFFWRPETLRSSLMNSITPIYWNFSKKILWPKLLGGLFFVLVFSMAVLSVLFKKNLYRFLPEISLVLMLAFGLHFIIRFIPMVHWQFYLTNSEKVAKYYPVPEFGRLAEASRRIIKPADSVVVFTEEGDWFSPKAACFNIAPVNCSYYAPGNGKYYRLIDKYERPKSIDLSVVDAPIGNLSKHDAVISYNASYFKLPDGYKKVYELNKNVFIAVKR